MSKKQKSLAVLASVFLMLFTIAPVSNAMHIMEGFLPVKYCILWGVICVPFLVIGFMNIKKVLGNDRRTLTVLALTGAFVFVLHLKDSFSNRKLFPYDRNRSWCNPVWTMCSECTWNHCSDLPGSVARPWRTDNTWSKLFFHGDCRSDPVLADL